MKIVCFILLVSFFVSGKAEDPPKPAPAPAPAAGAPAAGAPAAGTPGTAPVGTPAAGTAGTAPAGTPAAGAPAGSPWGGIPGFSALTDALKPAATGSGSSTGFMGGLESVKTSWNRFSDTVKGLGNVIIGA